MYIIRPCTVNVISRKKVSGISNNICYFSEERGLHLIIESVGADSPAFRSGAREGDVIVAVDDWLITPMDRPQVSDKSTHSTQLWVMKENGANMNLI